MCVGGRVQVCVLEGGVKSGLVCVGRKGGEGRDCACVGRRVEGRDCVGTGSKRGTACTCEAGVRGWHVSFSAKVTRDGAEPQ